MQDKIFLDSNILIYCYSNSELDKQKIARSIFENTNDIYISIQVINEVTNILFKKLKLATTDIINTILQISNLVTTFNFDINTQLEAIKIKEKYKLQYYDALIIATALENDCTVLYSEDMQNGLIINDTLTIVNPFKKV
jgi:predicted nucleic acid-binding protein